MVLSRRLSRTKKTMRKRVELVDVPTVHTTKDGSQYVDSNELLNSRIGRETIQRLRGANIVISSQCIDRKSKPGRKDKNGRRRSLT